MRTLLALLALTAALAQSPALAQAPAPDPDQEIVSPEEFRQYAEGYTLYFERDGQPFGAEAFEPGGKTRWRFTDGSCARGVWRPHGAQICFLYEMDAAPGPLCWRMLRDGEALIARRLDGEDAGMEITVTRRDRVPLLCGDPGRST